MKIKLLLLFFLVLVFNQLFWPGLHVAGDLPNSSASVVKSFFSLPQAYSSLEGPLGANKLTTLWSFPYNFAYGFLQFFGVGRNVEILLLGLVPILLIGGWGIWKISSLVGLNQSGKITAFIFFLSNTYIILLIDGGQLLWAFAYSFIPVCFYFLEKELQSLKKKVLLPVLCLIGLGFLDIRAVYLFTLVLFIRFLSGLWIEKKEWKEWLIFWFKFAFSYLLLFVLFNFYWLLPLFVPKNKCVRRRLSPRVLPELYSASSFDERSRCETCQNFSFKKRT
jgi:hypothetical protein